MLRGAHCLKAWSSTQTTIALSSAEAELTGLVAAATHSLGMRSLAHDLGISFTIALWSDAAAAIGIARRKGLGRVRHLDVADLWIQDKLREKEFTLNKVPGVDNPADMLTKYVPAATYKKHLTAISIGPEEGRVGSAPQLTEGQLGMEETSTSDAESSTGQPNKEASSGRATACGTLSTT